MNTKLAMLIIIEELRIATNVMAKGKSLGLNGMVVEIYTFSNLMGKEYFQMIKIVVKLGHLPKGSTKTWSFIYLNKKKEYLIKNWKPI
jgi:hypothetical protein